jgi:hypothetical protein
VSYVIHIINPPDTPSAWIRDPKHMQIGSVGVATLNIDRAQQFASTQDAQTYIDTTFLASITQFYHIETYVPAAVFSENY